MENGSSNKKGVQKCRFLNALHTILQPMEQP